MAFLYVNNILIIFRIDQKFGITYCDQSVFACFSTLSNVIITNLLLVQSHHFYGFRLKKTSKNLQNSLLRVFYSNCKNFFFPTGIFFESLYRYNHVCWLQAPSLIWGFLLPLGIMLLVNYGIFFILSKKVIWRKQKVCIVVITVEF